MYGCRDKSERIDHLPDPQTKQGVKHMKMARLQIEVPEALVKEFDTLQERLGISTRKDLICTSMEVLQWMVKKRIEGKKLIALDENSGIGAELAFLGLERLEPLNKSDVEPVPNKSRKRPSLAHA
jgi:hypothetical protein